MLTYLGVPQNPYLWMYPVGIQKIRIGHNYRVVVGDLNKEPTLAIKLIKILKIVLKI
jgi:hypothetical protein